MRLTEKIKLFNSANTFKKNATISNQEVIIKLGQLEDIEDRLSKFKDTGIDGLITLFKNLTDEDIEFIVQRAFKTKRNCYEIH